MKDYKPNLNRIIADEFKKLMMSESFEKITVKMIADRLGIHRHKFYNCYPDKYAIFQYILEDELFGIVETMIENGLYLEAIKMIFVYFHKERQFYKKALKITGQNSFRDTLHEMLSKAYKKAISKSGKEMPDDSIIGIDFLTGYYSAGFIYGIQWMLEHDNIINIEDIEKFTKAYLFFGELSFVDFMQGGIQTA